MNNAIFHAINEFELKTEANRTKKWIFIFTSGADNKQGKVNNFLDSFPDNIFSKRQINLVLFCYHCSKPDLDCLSKLVSTSQEGMLIENPTRQIISYVMLYMNRIEKHKQELIVESM